MSEASSSLRRVELLATFLLAVCACHAQEECVDETCANNANQCRFYLAESSIPESGVGMYTSVAIPSSTNIGGEITIPVSDLYTHNQPHRKTIDYDLSLRDYGWGESYCGGKHSEGKHEILGMSGMIGSLVNSHPALNNIDHVNPVFRPPLHPGLHPMASGVTSYVEGTYRALGDIEAGSELFTNYGENWFNERENIVGKIPLKRHYKIADRAVTSTTRFMARYDHLFSGNNRESVSLRRNLWNLVLSLQTEQRVVNALPSDERVLEEVAAIGTGRFALPESTRSQQWLEKHGDCIDQLMVEEGGNTVEGAGSGAVLRRKVKVGEVIVPVPLQHIPDAAVWNMHRIVDWSDDDGLVKGEEYADTRDGTDGVVQQQLILNYCFGHPNSTMMFYPYGSQIHMVNHASHTSSSKANAVLRWATPESNMVSRTNFNDPYLFQQPISHFRTVHHAILAMELVALRDIAAGEEILLDYGEEYQRAMEAHQAQWPKSHPTPEEERYMHSQHYNSIKEIDGMPVHTRFEEVNSPSTHAYPSNIKTGCYYLANKQPAIPLKQSKVTPQHLLDLPQNEWEALLGDKTLTVYSTLEYENFDVHPTISRWIHDEEDDWITDYDLYPCYILSREAASPSDVDTDYYYTAFIPVTDLQEEEINEGYDGMLVGRIPDTGVTFLDDWYTTPAHAKDAFRHFIGVPDGMYPPQWLNK